MTYHNALKPKGCALGVGIRYVQSDLELRAVQDLATDGRKVRPGALRGGRIDTVLPAWSDAQKCHPWKESDRGTRQPLGVEIKYPSIVKFRVT